MEDAQIGQVKLSPWRPESNPRRIAILGKLMEEKGEGIAAAARCLIQGIDESEPTTHKPNRKWLEDEFADVRALQRHAIDEFGLDEERINARAAAKAAQLTGWLDDIPPRADDCPKVG